MCYFLCISTSQELISNARLLPCGLYFEDASNTPIGLATRGNRNDVKSYLLLEGGCSCAIIGKGHDKKKFPPQRLIEIIVCMLKESPSVSVLLHTSRGNWADEDITVKRKQIVSVESFANLFPVLEEDVRYVIPKWGA